VRPTHALDLWGAESIQTHDAAAQTHIQRAQDRLPTAAAAANMGRDRRNVGDDLECVTQFAMELDRCILRLRQLCDSGAILLV
jgi:hypothetical protein